MARDETSAGQASPRPGPKRLPLRIPLRERIPLWIYVVVGGLLIVALGIGIPTYFGNRHMKSMQTSMQSSGGSLVGMAIQGFALKDSAGQTYTLTPGDGKTHLLVFYMGYFCGTCREQVGELAKSAPQFKQLADVVAISSDPPSELQKMDQLLQGAFRLLSDTDLRVIKQYQMEMMGGSPMADRGYAIIDGRGVVRVQKIDQAYGQHASEILAALKAAQAP